MSLQKFKSRNSLSAASEPPLVKRGQRGSKKAVREISLSIGIALLVGGGSAGATGVPLQIALDPPGRSNVRIPTEPQETEPNPTETEQSETPSETRTAGGSRFTCEVRNGEYTVMYHPQTQSGSSYAWATPSAMGGGWTPEARCKEITRRLEAYRPDGLREMRTAVENNYNVICVTTQKNGDCRIVLTVPEGQDPELTRDRVFENLTVADSGQQTDAVNAIVDGGRRGGVLGKIEDVLGGGSRGGNASAVSPGSIDLRPFLSPADGGTGARLQGGMSSPSNPQLNPENFR